MEVPLQRRDGFLLEIINDRGNKEWKKDTIG